MRLKSLVCCFAFAAVNSCATITYAAERYAHVTFDAPAGWMRSDVQDWAIFTPPNVPVGHRVAIYLSSGAASSQEFKPEFDATVDALARQFGTPNADEAETSIDAAGNPVLEKTIVCTPAAGGESTIQIYTGHRANGRVELSFLTSDDHEHLADYMKTYMAFASGQTFTADAVPATPPVAAAQPAATPAATPQPEVPVAAVTPAIAPTPDVTPVAAPAAEPAKEPLTIAPAQPMARSLSGWHVYSEVSFNGMNFITTCWYQPDGRVYLGRHFGGTTAADFEALEKAEPQSCGTYGTTLDKDGDVIVTTQQNGTKYPRTIGGVEDKLMLFAKGKRLDGNYSRSSSMSSYGSGGFTAAAGAYYTFHPDGKFEGEEYAGVEGTNGSIGAGEKSDHGTYAIDGPTITFTYSNGLTATMTIAGTHEEAKPWVIMLGDSDLRLQS